MTTRDPGVLAWLRLARIYTEIDHRTASFLRAFDLTTAQFDVIAQVGAHEGVTQQELAEALLVTKGNVTQLLNRLEERGLLERRSLPGRRGKCIFLTESGWRLNREVVPAQEAHIAGIFASMPIAERTALHTMLRTVDRMLGTPGEGVL